MKEYISLKGSHSVLIDFYPGQQEICVAAWLDDISAGGAEENLADSLLMST